MYSRYIGFCAAEYQMPKERGRDQAGVRHYLQEVKNKFILYLSMRRLTKTHTNAVEQYKNPDKRRGGKRQSVEEVAHKAAWAAVKNQYRKKGDKWVRKE